MNKTLYGKTKTNSYKVWNITVVGDEIVITHGKKGGKLQTKTEKVRGKNIGRSNETTPEQQAISEAESRYKKQVDKGYREHIDDLEELEILPMLASDYLKQGHRIEYPCYVSAKLDGCRCLAIRHATHVELKSRGGKQYNVPHIQAELMNFMEIGEIWDGELYIDGKFLEEIVSAIKKPNDSTPDLSFVIFDVVLDDKSFEYRLAVLEGINSVLDKFSMHLNVLPYQEVFDESEMEQWHDIFVSKGYEGICLRNKNGVYESGKRSADLQKFKKFFDEEFQIVGVKEDRNGNGVFELFDKTADSTFTCTYGSFDQRKYQLVHPEEFIGKYLTVKYQSRYKDSKLVQFPVGISFRECDTTGIVLI